MNSTERFGVRRSLLALVAVGLVVAALLWLDRGSLERGNRLYRGGDAGRAAALYRHAADGDDETHPLAPYNLGTALLGLDPDSAETSLRIAAQAEDPTIAQRGLYNLGYRYLTSVSGAMEPDSMVATLVQAVASLRGALRMNPSDAAARWNLALAQRKLDALAPAAGTPDTENSGESDDELEVDDLALARSEDADAVSGLEPEDPTEVDNRGQRSGAQQGAREAWAAQDPGPMTPGAAFGLLGQVDDDPEKLVRGILWSHRPEVPWWESHAYPGGAW